jgi:CBS domain-containing protein
MQVRDVMSSDILKVGPGMSALEVGSLMDSKEIGAAAVVEDGRFLGILSKETFVANLEKFCERPIDSLRVSDLMEADIDSVRAEDDIYTAVDLLLSQKGIIDRLPVVGDGRVIGFVSKLDFTGLFARQMRGRFKVADLMHYSPSTVFDYTPLDRVIDEIRHSNVKRVLVLSGSSLVGIISVRDLSVVLFRKRKLCMTVDPTSTLKAEDVMTRNPVTAKGRIDAAEAARMMVEKKVGGIPIIDGGLEGIISRTDLLKGLKLAHS